MMPTNQAATIERAEAGVDGDDDAGDDLDGPDGVHQLVWGERQRVGEHRGQVAVPVDHPGGRTCRGRTGWVRP